jgi:hypothetical protein
LQGRTHQIKQLLTDGQKQYLREWLSRTSPQAWAEAEDHFKVAFDSD